MTALVPTQNAELVPLEQDVEPPELYGDFLEQYRQERDRLDQAFSGFPEHQKVVLWVLTRRLSEAHVMSMTPEVRANPALWALQDRALLTVTKELGQFTRAVDHLEVQKTQMVITILSVVGDAVADVIEDMGLRQTLMGEIRRRCLQLFD